MKGTLFIINLLILTNIADAQRIKIEDYSYCASENFQLLVNQMQYMQRVGEGVDPYGAMFTKKYSKRLVNKDVKMILKTNSIAYMQWADIYNGGLKNQGFKYIGNSLRKDTCYSENAMSGRYVYTGGYFQAIVHIHSDTSIHCRFKIIYPRIGKPLLDCDGCSYTYAFHTFVPFLKYRFKFEDYNSTYVSFTFKCLPAGKIDCD
jgi:hypothetical protein